MDPDTSGAAQTSRPASYSEAAAQPLSNESSSAEIRNELLSPGIGAQLRNADMEEKMRKRLEGASSWRGFFTELGVKMGLLIVLVLAIWLASVTL